MIPCPRDVHHFWQEYNIGINGNPSLRSLEKKSKNGGHTKGVSSTGRGVNMWATLSTNILKKK